MSKLEKLIKELCPNRVEYKSISDMVDYEQPSQYIVKSTDYNDDFKIPVLTAGQSFILGYTNETDNLYNASKENPVIIFDDFTGAFKWVDFPFKVKSSAMKMLKVKSTDTTLRYIYHIMGNIGYSSNEHKRLWISIYSAIKIPIPPLSVQAEIVRILDNFTELKTELTTKLTAELTARKKQYEYYRGSLLTFGNNVPTFKLTDIAEYSKDRIDACNIDASSYIGVDNLLQEKKGKVNSSYVPTKGKLTKYHKGDILIGNIRPYLRKIWFADNEGGTNGDVLAIHPISNKINPKYLFVQLSSEDFFNYDIQKSKGAKMPRGSKDAVMLYEIPVPSLKEQAEIVDKIDKFNILCNDISSGLPAEIEARQKQYEYYRDKLLDFKNIDSSSTRAKA